MPSENGLPINEKLIAKNKVSDPDKNILEDPNSLWESSSFIESQIATKPMGFGQVIMAEAPAPSIHLSSVLFPASHPRQQHATLGLSLQRLLQIHPNPAESRDSLLLTPVSHLNPDPLSHTNEDAQVQDAKRSILLR